MHLSKSVNWPIRPERTMYSNVCRACLRPLHDTNDIVHILNNLYRDVHNLSMIIHDVFKIKVSV